MPNKNPVIYILHLTDIVTYEECNNDESYPIGNGMFDPSSGIFTSQSTEPALFSFSATSLLKAEYNSPVHIKLIKHKLEGGEKVMYVFNPI